MIATRLPEFVRIPSVAAPCGRWVAVTSVTLAAAFALIGCASRGASSFFDAWDPGVEVRFPATDASSQQGIGQPGGMTRTQMAAAPEAPLLPPPQRIIRGVAAVAVAAVDQSGAILVSRPLMGIADQEDTKYTLIPGSYAFEYDDSDASRVFGAIHLYPVTMPRAREFIRFAAVPITPGRGERPSVLSRSDLDRARSGDVVTKVVFMADLRVIRDRLEDIERELRELAWVRTSLEGQKEYWDRKLAQRRSNAMSSGDYGWGLDVPGVDLEILQNIVGPERYHWHRFSEAEDQVRTYEEKMARLDLPERRLNEEREALSAILNSTDVIHRAADQMILASSMIRPYHDPVDEVHQWRGWGCLRYPYRYSSWPMWGLAPADRRVAAPSGGRTEPVGEVLMVVQAGARRPIELGGHSWASTR